ncbi:MAG: DUF456 domain-containing protein [Bacteroidales bacterium]|nr:DUF456 domain-containing protein [Bacteroidales bacterium]
MEIVIIILAILAGIIGIAGSILPGLPGAPFSWIGLLLLFIWGPESMPVSTLVIWGAVVIAVSVIDYLVPMWLTKATGGSRYAERGAMAGLVIGIVLTPVGMILGSFLGAFLAEIYWGKKSAGDALKAAFGSFLGFITGTGLKTIVAVLIMWRIIVFAF